MKWFFEKKDKPERVEKPPLHLKKLFKTLKRFDNLALNDKNTK